MKFIVYFSNELDISSYKCDELFDEVLESVYSNQPIGVILDCGEESLKTSSEDLWTRLFELFWDSDALQKCKIVPIYTEKGDWIND